MALTVLLLSLRPEHAHNIFHGNKTVELRRVKPRVRAGDILFVYVSSPVKALCGICEVTNVIAGSPDHLWKETWTVSGITQKQFDDYYAGASTGFAIEFKNAQLLPCPLDLACLKEHWDDFTAPQSYRYLTQDEIRHVNFLLGQQAGETNPSFILPSDPDLFTLVGNDIQ